MYRIIDDSNTVFTQYRYVKESDFEKMVVSHADAIFGGRGVYFDAKRRIGTARKGAAIPDGYYLDLTFHTDPKLYLVEIELNSHDVYGHIGEQLLRFGIASENDKYKIKNILVSQIEQNPDKKKRLVQYLEESAFSSISEVFDRVIFVNKPAALIVIDETSPELYHLLGQLTMPTEIIEAQTYVYGDKKLHRFTPFKDDVLEDLPATSDADDLDTIVVPARKEGFEAQFLGRHRWYSIRISGAMLEKIKYIAAYQVAPVSAITHIAEVERIEKYLDSNKYILYFKPDSTQQINQIALGANKGYAPQAPRYTSHQALLLARTLDDLWQA